MPTTKHSLASPLLETTILQPCFLPKPLNHRQNLIQDLILLVLYLKSSIEITYHQNPPHGSKCLSILSTRDGLIDQLTHKKVWKIIKTNEKEPGKIAIPTTWVFRYKFDEDGFLTKFKARLCARGDKQHTQADTFAATLAIRIFRALMALVAAFDLETR